MIDHVTVTSRDLARSTAFYDAALQPLGLRRVVDYVDPEDEDEGGIEAVGYGAATGAPTVWVVAGAAPTSGLHLALRAENSAAVEAFFAAALSAGGTPAQAPRRWEIYRPGYFGAMVADPDGNLIEAVTSTA
ncbi:MAG: VOC family protein [Jatrophihabitans sp.]